MTKKSKLIEPGSPVRNSESGQPIMAVLDLLGRRWALRILWELRDGQRRSFRTLQDVCQMSSPNVLNTRLKELRHARVIDLADGGGFGLTESGRQLLAAMHPLSLWAEAWAISVGREDLAHLARSAKKTQPETPVEPA
ncbi:winged helix-turn-helix transcriptional regulator [Noviherbaspirillum galbum]|uniref:Helix-turn-helix transcriptional regulator n=1 Tax=Noviherbaspirillum galbum TaxID=2709383 RepID=A0A6B3SRY9_9BURK|nr:helix-turn-helix domain-containing protein [Noviherbaspirillum galbum]NEX62105.1 helix-turn-helix transcriptional regulator [Noviherbaspirillum galbum]